MKCVSVDVPHDIGNRVGIGAALNDHIVTFSHVDVMRSVSDIQELGYN
jgi:hypothetical protein